VKIPFVFPLFQRGKGLWGGGIRGKPTASPRFSPSPLVPLPSRERGKRKGDIPEEIERDFVNKHLTGRSIIYLKENTVLIWTKESSFIS
jgi:hypothetical protein